MEQENNLDEKNKKDYFLPASILISSIIIAAAWVYTAGLKVKQVAPQTASPAGGSLAGDGHQDGTALPSSVELPVAWNDIGAQMIKVGVIDESKLESLYAGRGGLQGAEKKLLTGIKNGKIRVTQENSGFLLNLFWALGLSNKNAILEKGPMVDPRYGGSDKFASTGGWTLAKDSSSTGLGASAMDHYSKHAFITLAQGQQALVERVSKNIYRPCCDNSTYFPDCNHGMAMLGLLELLASQGASEAQMYKSALQMNTFWFPDQYDVIAKYLESKGISPQAADPKEILGSSYSSGSGYRRIESFIPRGESKRGGSCGV